MSMSGYLDHYSLFSDSADREHYLSLLETCLQRANTRCYAWILMNNQYHLVIRISDHGLWEIMKPLNMRYAQYHRKKTSRCGFCHDKKNGSTIVEERMVVI